MNYVQVLDILVCSVFDGFGPGLKLFHQICAAQTIFMALGVLNRPQLQHICTEDYFRSF